MKVFQRGNTYDNGFVLNSVYGHALELLKRHTTSAEQALHLDVGCGFGRIAEPIVAALGCIYVGCDLDELGLASLSTRGFETHSVALSSEDEIYRALTAVVAGRPLASISIIDTLEHVFDPIGTIRALRRIAEDTGAIVVISVPNTAHRDLGARLLFGKWDYTEAGILDHTHRFLYSDSVLTRLLGHAGLRVVDANDFPLTVSDQAFPPDHPVFQRHSILSQLLTALRQNADEYSYINQLVRLCVPAQVETLDPFVGRDDGTRPFLSIVMRTQGTRVDSLTEILTCLTGQSTTDFEILLLGHKLDTPRRAAVERVIADLPAWMQAKVRFIPVDHGSRTTPLNIGFAAASGQFIVTLDDDDTVFGNWVEAFADLAAASPGPVLRTVAVTQTIVRIDCGGVSGLRAKTGMVRSYPSELDWFDTLRVNRSPTMTLAYPRGVFHHLGIMFDEELTTTEDWDYLLRATALVGAVSTPAVTAIYRFWEGSATSATEHSKEEWTSNYNRVIDKLDDSTAVIWPVGTTKRVRDLMNRNSELEQLLRDHSPAGINDAGTIADRMEALRAVVNIFQSTSWRLTAPVRFLGRLAGKPVSRLDEAWWLSAGELRNLAASLQQSTSWRLSAPLRRWKR